MTGPVQLTASSDLATAAHRRLVSVPGIFGALLSPPGANPGGVWLFVRKLYALVEGSGRAAVVLREDGPWARPNAHNTARFPRLSVEIYADSTRDPSGAIAREDAEARARAVWERFQEVLHRTTAFEEVWGAGSNDMGVRVWGSTLMALPDVYPLSDWDGGVRLQCHYGLSVG